MTKFHQRSMPPWPIGVPFEAAYDWALAQMPCPAFRCDSHGAVAFYNAAAERLWGAEPPAGIGRWGGFAALWRSDGTPVEPADSPVALAATGAEILPAELVGAALDGQFRRVVFHARAALDGEGRLSGTLCALTDVSERRRLEGQADAALNERTLFLSMLGHELRNPLAPIMSAAAAMGELSSDPAISRMADIVERQAKQLARFVSDLLNAARLGTADRLPIAMRDSCLGEIIDRAVDVVAAAARARGQTLSINARDREARLLCDPERLAQALGNALLNASEHSPSGAQIRLCAEIANEVFQARVSDDGAGVERGRLEQIFEPFKSFATPIGRANPAAGLGLWIAKSVAEAHGGVVFARSRGIGTGTTIVFALPIASPES